jgi:hypothetical protein
MSIVRMLKTMLRRFAAKVVVPTRWPKTTSCVPGPVQPRIQGPPTHHVFIHYRTFMHSAMTFQTRWSRTKSRRSRMTFRRLLRCVLQRVVSLTTVDALNSHLWSSADSLGSTAAAFIVFHASTVLSPPESHVQPVTGSGPVRSGFVRCRRWIRCWKRCDDRLWQSR